MRSSYAILCLLFIFSSGLGVADAQSYSIKQSMGLTSGFSQTVNSDYLGFSGPGFGFNVSFPWFDWEFDEPQDMGDMYSYFSEYYISTGIPVVGGIISTPVRFDITRSMPTKIYLGSGQQVSYSQYATSAASTRGNELWIQGPSEWSQYAVVPTGKALQLIAYVPAGGQVDVLEVVQTNTVDVTSKRYQFYSGYNSMNFPATEVGRHILVFLVNNLPSNVIVVDVISEAPPAIQTQQPVASMSPTNIPVTYGQSVPVSGPIQTIGGSFQYTQPITSPASIPQPVPSPSTGDTPVTIQTSLKGYDVYLDGVMIGKEGTGGDILDGTYKFKVVGGQTHDVKIFDGEWFYGKPMFFERGVSKIINVPPATTLYRTSVL